MFQWLKNLFQKKSAPRPLPLAVATVNADDWQPTTAHGRYLRFELERSRERDAMLQRFEDERAARARERDARQLRIANRMPSNLVMFYWKEGRITDGDWRTYLLSDDGDYLPPIKGINC